MNNKKCTFKVSVATNKGCRSYNEDTFCIVGKKLPKPGVEYFEYEKSFSAKLPQVFAVFDGMGGTNDGNLASASIATSFYKKFNSNFKIDKKSAINPLSNKYSSNGLAPIEYAKTVVLTMIDEVHKALKNRINGGTTIAIAVVFPTGDYLFVNVGDSPGFHLSQFGCHELSVRHNEAFRLQREAAKRGEWYGKGSEGWESSLSELYACVGLGYDLPPSAFANICTGKLKDGDALMLCSDGISEALTPEEVLVKRRSMSIKDIAATAVRINGAKSDNATLMWVQYNC